MKTNYVGQAKQFMDTGMNSIGSFAAKQKDNLKTAGKAAIATTAAVGSSAMAAVDVAGVSTAIGVAETSAHSIGTVVIGVVAGLAVVGIVLGLVRKL